MQLGKKRERGIDQRFVKGDFRRINAPGSIILQFSSSKQSEAKLYIVSADRYFTVKNNKIEPLNEYQAKAMVYINMGVEGYLQLFKFLTDYEFEEIKAYIAESLENFNKEKEIFSESLIM